MATRRERLRAATIRDIKAAALAQVRRDGAPSLSLRAVARDLDMSAPGLYRYFDDRDALLTALIADAYGDLADAVTAAGGDRDDADVAGRLLDRALAYRGWAVAHPAEFGLVYGSPIPGYVAPEGGPTVTPVVRLGAAFVELLVAASHQGLLRRPPPTDVDRDVAAALAAYEPGHVPPEAVSALMGAWGRMHGLVSLEVFGHLDWLGTDLGALYEHEMRAMVAGLGLDPAGGPPSPT